MNPERPGVLHCVTCHKAIDLQKGYYTVGGPHCSECGDVLYGDRPPYWADRDPNFTRLQMSICRRDVLLGRDEVIKLGDEPSTKTT